ncbi:MAG: hypothetical protein P8K79_09980 [Mariniblastus sp.]|nr:hypothetical protein [Mariniblastus sp.]
MKDLFQTALFDTEMTLTSVVFLEDDTSQDDDSYVGEINFAGDVPGHGQFVLNYHNRTPSPGSRTAGDFTGNESVLQEDGTKIVGTVRGIWQRSGSAMKIFALTNQSNATQNLRVIDVKIHDNPNRTARVVSYQL